MASIQTKGIIATVNAKEIGCFQSIGDIDLSREAKEYECVSTGLIEIALGNIKAGDIPVSVKYNPEDVAGAGELESAFFDGTPTPFSVELNNAVTPSTGNGTTFAWTGAGITNLKITPETNGLVLASFTLKLNGAPTVTAAA